MFCRDEFLNTCLSGCGSCSAFILQCLSMYLFKRTYMCMCGLLCMCICTCSICVCVRNVFCITDMQIYKYEIE